MLLLQCTSVGFFMATFGVVISWLPRDSKHVSDLLILGLLALTPVMRVARESMLSWCP